jgi:hypothetical protein
MSPASTESMVGAGIHQSCPLRTSEMSRKKGAGSWPIRMAKAAAISVRVDPERGQVASFGAASLV